MTVFNQFRRLLDALLFMALAAGALARIIEVPSNNFIIKGTTAEFQCCSDIRKTFFWQVKKVGLRPTSDIYTDGLVNGFRDTGRFNVNVGSSSGCNKLIISEVKLEDAGTYSCVDDEGLGQKIIWELTVVESFNCRGTNPKSEYMGHNSFGLPQDVISTVCISKYFGNVPPTLICKWLSGRQTFSIHQFVTEENFTTTLNFQVPAIKELNEDHQLCYVEITGKSSDNRNPTAWKSPRLFINYAEFQHNRDSKCSVDGLSLDCQPPCEHKIMLLSNGSSYCEITYPSKTQNTFYVSPQDYNPQGSIHTSANIPDETNTTSWAVDHPPFFVESPPKFVFFRGDDNVDLRYSTAGTLPSAFKWKKNGVDLDLNEPNIRQDLGTIRISPANQLDEGYYQCIAKNRYGVTVSNVTNLQRAVLQPVGPTQLTNQLEVFEGRPLVIPASMFKVIPKPKNVEQYVWMRYAADLDVKPQLIIPDRRIQINENGDLHFAYVNASDDLGGKLYVNAVFNPFLNVTIEGNYTQLTVKMNPTGDEKFAPELSFHSVSKTPALEGENVTMRCFFSGRDEPAIDWLLQRGSLEFGRYTVNDDKTELTLINITASDEMLYYCMGGNSLGSKTQEIPLKIEASPRFVKPGDGPQHKTALAKENVAFRCNAYAKPDASIVWFYNGQSLNENPRKRFTISVDQMTLTISSVCLECKDSDRGNVSDSGVIQCNASNVHGYALGTGYLDVISMQSGGVVVSGATQETSIPFEVAFIVILTIAMLISF